MDPLGGTKPKATAHPAARSSHHGIAAELVAVLVAVTAGEPRVLTIQDQGALPSGPFELAHRSLQSGLRAWVERQTGLPLGYVEQLYTFADQDRAGVAAKHVISVSYLGLTREQPASGEYKASWRSWYEYFPWEDHRLGAPPLIEKTLRLGLAAWAAATPDRAIRAIRRQRSAMLCCLEQHAWNEELVLQRYELLYEARLIPEALRDNPSAPVSDKAAVVAPGNSMVLDHRRILATGIARLRAKIKYHTGGVRTDAGHIHAAATATLHGSPGRASPLQAEFPPPDRTAGACRGNRRHESGHRGASGKIVPVPTCGIYTARPHRFQIATFHLTRLILQVHHKYILSWSIYL